MAISRLKYKTFQYFARATCHVSRARLLPSKKLYQKLLLKQRFYPSFGSLYVLSTLHVSFYTLHVTRVTCKKNKHSL